MSTAAANAPPEPQLHTLSDGSEVELRRLRPSDKARLSAAFASLSEESRYRRFFTPLARLSARYLRYLTEVDHHDHLAWGAIDPHDPERPGLGVARCIRLVDEPTVAEAAVTVVDPWQGRGLGPLLLDVLAQDARAHGIEAFRGYVLSDNAPMRSLIEHGGGRADVTEGGLLCIDLPLPAAPRTPWPAARHLLRSVGRSDVPRAHNPFVEAKVDDREG